MSKNEKKLKKGNLEPLQAGVSHSDKKILTLFWINNNTSLMHEKREEVCIIKHEVKFLINKKYTKPEIVLSPEEQKNKLDEAEQSVAKQSSKKKKLLNIGFFVLNIAILAGILTWNILTEGFVPLGDIPLHGWAIVIIILFFIVAFFCEVLAMSYLLKKSTGKFRFGLCTKMNTIGHYYDAVTPLATGGQPFQVTYLKSHEVPLHSALAIPMAKYIFSQIVWVVVSFVCMIISFTDPNNVNGISYVAIIGFVLSSFMLFIVAFLSISKSVGRKLVVKILKLLQKMKIVKDYEKQYTKISKYIEDFQSVIKQYITSFKDFIVLFGLLLLKLFFTYSIPYFIVCLFTGFQSANFITYFVMAIMVDLAASLFPLPGGSGMSEVSFKLMFTTAFAEIGGGAVVWALLLWRLMSYYIFLLMGISVLTYDFAYGNKRYRWLKRKEQLVEESKIFKQEQINRFRSQRNKRRRSNSI